MGREYTKRVKEQYGRQAVVMNEVVHMGGNLAPASASGTLLSDAFSVAEYRVARPAKLDGITVNVSPQLVAGSGSVAVRALVNGTPVATATVAAGEKHGDTMQETERDLEVRLVASDELTLDVVKGATPSGVDISARVGLRLFEV